ncbi:hypothetical protein PA598K_06895 [Paenibacillus sp. 598K]|uniref:hypothetical protein n=1 Tax=Paenibacillus sp. 598K TaxID=1117987 RepID=UPI000FFAF97F|nr:hypothetical protein [Paenibacillus sp. 598K]GBF78277.1 hypothetical protein PA598K_06895 [Paenibacillus sp. 598K]
MTANQTKDPATIRRALERKYFPRGLEINEIRLLDEIQLHLMDAAEQTVGVERWSNAANLGYAIVAGLSVGMSPKEVEKLVSAMRVVHDNVSVAEAASHYNRSPF